MRHVFQRMIDKISTIELLSVVQSDYKGLNRLNWCSTEQSINRVFFCGIPEIVSSIHHTTIIANLLAPESNYIMNFAANLKARITGKTEDSENAPGKQTKSAESNSEPDSANPNTEEEAVKEEKFLSTILEVSRKIFYEKHLVGSIYLSRSFAFYSSSLSCDVDWSTMSEEVTTASPSVAEDVEGMTRFEKKVVKAVQGAVRTLQSRARAYRNKPYRDGITLTCGISVSDPFLGLISTSVSCSATIASLLAESGANDGSTAI